MKNRIKLVLSLAVFSMLTVGAFAQRNNSNYSYEYNDDIYLDDNYDRSSDSRYGDRNYDDRRRVNDRYYDDRRRNNQDFRGNNRGRNNRSARYIRSQRNRKAAILERAYFRAYADGWLSRRERRELRQLESRLGIYRLDRRGRRICR